MADVMTGMERTIKRNMLKYHVGQTMFCPGCNAIMDCKRAVELDISKEGKLLASKITCASCFDSRIKPVLSKFAEYTVEINDGRELFKR